VNVRRSKRTADTASTKRKLVEAATRQFGARGFDDASLVEIAREAGLTTGAIYHHFGDKRGLFQAAAESIEVQIAAQIEAKISGLQPWAALLEGIDTALSIAMLPHVQRIVIVDAPMVIGPAEWRAIQTRHGLGLLTSRLKQLSDEGVLQVEAIELTARLLLSAVIAAAEACAASPEPEKTAARSKRVLERFVGALRTS
jgi:AcrR family transcriptional regulator